MIRETITKVNSDGSKEAIIKGAPSVTIKINKTGRRWTIIGDLGIAEVYLGVTSDNWHLSYPIGTRGEVISSFSTALEEALKLTDRKFSQMKFKELVDIAREGESEEENPRKNHRRNPLYQTFHGNPPRNVRQVEFHELKPGDRLVKLGRLLEVVYLPEGATQHKGIAYSHKFPDWGDGRKGGERPVLAVSQDGKQLFVINDRAKPKVGRRGIVG